MWADLPRGTAQTGGHRGPLHLDTWPWAAERGWGWRGFWTQGPGAVTDVTWGLMSWAPSNMVSVGGSAPPWLGGLLSTGAAEVGGDAPPGWRGPRK